MKMIWISGGVLLVLCVLSLRRLEERGPVHTLAGAFTLLWGAFAAMHAWRLSLQVLVRLPLPKLTAGQLTALAYWCALVLAVLPGVLLLGRWLKRHAMPLPPALHTCVLWGCSACVAAWLALLVLMTVELCASPRATGGRSGGLRCRLGRLPVQAYVALAARSRAPAERWAREGRLPVMARSALLPDRAAAGPDSGK